jgi:diketogulonate reductase-like aldo/keto reductase
MQIPLKTLNNGFSMPAFGFGTYRLGDSRQYIPGNDGARDIAAIRAAIDHGLTHIDTAEIYAGGYTEKMVGQVLKDYDRSKIFLVSKVHQAHMRHDDVIAACKNSLQRLGTDYLDMYLLHRHVPAVPLEESIGALNELKELGLIRNLGVSNFLPEPLAQAQKISKYPIVCNQVHYNLEFREPEASGLLKYCQDNDVLLSAWRPVGKGALTHDVPDVVERICKKYEKTPSQIAINWLISQFNVVTLAMTRNLAHLEENLGAVGWTMEREDIELLRREYPGQKKVSNSVPLA